MGGRPSPPDQPRRRSVRRGDGQGPPREGGPALHPLEPTQTRRPSAPQPQRRVHIGRERLRQILHRHGISFQRTRTWKTSNDPDFDAKLDRIDEVLTRFPKRCFAFDQFGPLSIRPHHGSGWAPRTRPGRLPATYRRTHGIRYFHGCFSIGDDKLWGVTRRRKGGDHSLAALKSIRAARPDGAPIYVIMDNLSANKIPKILTWATANNVEICLTPTYASWANPIEPRFGPLRTFVIAGSNHPNHTALARELQAHLRRRNANARHPDVLAAQRRERARIRSERHQRWGRPRAA
nr:IS630 family transposase [Saccharothrix sp. ALI-22-I]